MKFRHIRSSQSSEATLWFLGWGFDSSIEPFIADEGNVYLLWDYTSLELSLDASAFSSVTVKAWSMGVWAAEAFLDAHTEVRASRTEAYCGTPLPADASYGIGAEAIRLTIDHWDEVNRRKFARKVAVDSSLAATLSPLLETRGLDSQRSELQSILDAQTELPRRVWDLAVVSKRDRIFPVASQRAWWSGRARSIDERDIPHWPFSISPQP